MKPMEEMITMLERSERICAIAGKQLDAHPDNELFEKAYSEACDEYLLIHTSLAEMILNTLQNNGMPFATKSLVNRMIATQRNRLKAIAKLQ